MLMKPIETEYKGYRFRSRLEARWAVFFDALNIRYEYEKEGFNLGKDGKYLPDFYLPQLDCWFEVKGKTPTEEERNKARALNNMTDQVVIISTEPFDKEYVPMCEVYAGDTTESSGGDYCGVGFLEVFKGKLIFSLQDNDKRLRKGERVIYSSGSFEHTIDWIIPDGLSNRIEMHESQNGLNDDSIYEEIYKMQKSVFKARAARFEFNR